MATAKKKSSSRSKTQSKAKSQVKQASAANQAWAQQSAKLYPFNQFNGSAAEDATKAAAQQMQSATEQMMKYGSDFMNQVFANSPINMTKNFSTNGMFNEAQNKAQKTAQQSADHFSRASNAATKSLNDAAELSRDHAETLVECSNIAVAASKQLGAELSNYINRAFSNNVELSKQVLTCRTLNDMFDLNNKFVKSNLDAFFNESVKLSELMFQAASDVSEPLNERISDATNRLTKSFAA